jgi:oligopeptide/dipeptide ABC transporter ATP-binding protein
MRADHSAVHSTVQTAALAGGAVAGQGEPLLEVRNLQTHFTLRQGTVRAVNGVDFTIRRGQTLGIVGESGCGKSITAQSILRIVRPPGKIVGGEILLHRRVPEAGGGTRTETVDLAKLDEQGREMHRIRGGEIAMVFQEPLTSLSPVYTVGNQVIEAALLHTDLSKAAAKEFVLEMLRRVGFSEPRRAYDAYPHELSGGMRQRAVIAMALVGRPSLLIADEPTTALDVTTEAQILRLLKELQADLGMAIMFITHDLGVIAKMADEVAVMYLGKVVEQTDVDSLFYAPKHPYLRALLDSVPRLGHARGVKLRPIQGMVPDPFNVPRGCPFHPRCPEAMAGHCDVTMPPLTQVGVNHRVACHLYPVENGG